MENTAEEFEDDMKSKFLTFLTDEELYGIELKNVKEIVGLQPITSVPEMPECIKGIINLRGVIIPVMDLRLRFNKSEKEYGSRTCIIIIDFGGKPIGLIVDSVSEVQTISEEDISKKPEIVSKGNRGFVDNIGKLGEKVVLLIDCGKLLGEDEIGNVAAQV